MTDYQSAAQPIAQLGAEVLRLTAQPITDFHAPETRALICALKDTLANSEGVGLAAPQIGYSQRAIIVASRPNRRYPYAPDMLPTVMLNPSFRPVSDVQEPGWEGCLSIPGIRALVPRFAHIAVSYWDENGLAVNTQFNGFVARVFQHEHDHLDGLVYLDRVASNRDIVAESEFFKRLDS